jgi:hypothetical protein
MVLRERISDISEEDVEIIEITAYILVEKSSPPQMRGGRATKLSESEKYVQRGPFKFKSADRYSSFIVQLLHTLPCPVLSIPQEKIIWRPQTPKSATPLLLGGETGYSAMVDAMTGSKKKVVMLMMLPPAKPAEKLVSTGQWSLV